MDKKMKVIAIIVAAGKSKRIKDKLPKQFLKIGKKPVLAHTLESFEKCEEVDEIILVVSEDWLTYCSTEVVDKYEFKKIKRVISGGEKRQDSVYKALVAVPNNTSIVVIHDGVRPLLNPSKITESIKICKECQAVILAVPVKETVKRIEDGSVHTTLNRERLWNAQTPQVFDYKILLDAFGKAKVDGFTGTDDASLVERLGVEVKIIEGDYDNIKITTPEDLILAEEILKKRKN
jgi:2-C-methyl-D-erythritol 4-phosphate cytidylyltransferase